MQRKSYSYYMVVDYDYSVGVVGIGFLKAPKILSVVKNGNVTPDLFNQVYYVFSYAMICYEMVTKKVLFENNL